MNGLKKLGSKKGNVPLEAIIGMFLLFTIAIFWVVSSLVFTDITEAMVEDGDLDPIANTSITNLESRFSETDIINNLISFSRILGQCFC